MLLRPIYIEVWRLWDYVQEYLSLAFPPLSLKLTNITSNIAHQAYFSQQAQEKATELSTGTLQRQAFHDERWI